MTKTKADTKTKTKKIKGIVFSELIAIITSGARVSAICNGARYPGAVLSNAGLIEYPPINTIPMHSDF